MPAPIERDDPQILARELYALASLIEFWIARKDPAKPLGEEDLALALDPFVAPEESPEFQALEALPRKVRVTMAESLQVGIRELKPVLTGAEGSLEDAPQAIALARGKIRGLLRIVEKLNPDGLTGWMEEIWEIHVAHVETA